MSGKAFHYPPELLELMIETIPLLCRSKKGTLGFFAGAGVAPSLYSDLSKTVQTDKESISKYEIVRTVLTRLNEKGEATLGNRREVLKRVVEFEDFSTCWPNDQLKARGLVSQIQKVVNVKDSFTRMDDERKAEQKKRTDEKQLELQAKAKKKARLETLKSELFALFNETDAKKRGKQLEIVLNNLFSAYEILVRESFSRTGDQGEGVIEQVDGVIELDNHVYFVEMKWWNKPVGVPEVSQHLVRVYGRAEGRAVIISASDFTTPAIAICKEALTQKVVTLCTLQELVMLLEKMADLKEFLRSKINAAIVDKEPFPKID